MVLPSLHWMDKGSGYVFRAPPKVDVQKSEETLQGVPNYLREYKFNHPEILDAHGVVPVVDKPIKSSNFYTLGVDLDSKGRVMSRAAIPMGVIPEANVDIKIDQQYIPHYGTYDDYMMGGMYNEQLAQGDMLL